MAALAARAAGRPRGARARAQRSARCGAAGGGGGAPGAAEREEGAGGERAGGELQRRRADLNSLYTRLTAALRTEDYEAAAALRDAIAAERGLPAGATGSAPGAVTDWRLTAGLPEWLADRLERMGFAAPTAVQAEALKALAPCAGARGHYEGDPFGSDGFISACPGSGKTLAYLVPALANLTPNLESVSEICREGGTSLVQPLVVICVPTKELGAQLALLIWRLLGGNTTSAESRGPGDATNMFQYMGPRGVRVVGMLDDDDVTRATEDCLLDGASIVVGRPDVLNEAYQRGALDMPSVQYLVVDEADECLSRHYDAVAALLASPPGGPRQTVLCGATVPRTLRQAAVRSQWVIGEPALISDRPLAAARAAESERGAAEDGEGTGEGAEGGASDSDEGAGEHALWELPSSITHRAVVADSGRTLVTLTRLMRADCEAAAAAGTEPPRTVVYVAAEEEAALVATALRKALWGHHTILALLPSGVAPLRTLEMFRDGAGTALVATPSSSRGLDFPRVARVYLLWSGIHATDLDALLPADEALAARVEESVASADKSPWGEKDYVHAAGRTGRIGNAAQGVVTTLCTSRAELEAVEAVGRVVGVDLEEIEPPEFDATSVDALNDLFYLLGPQSAQADE